jgi:hypothetical protein
MPKIYTTEDAQAVMLTAIIVALSAIILIASGFSANFQREGSTQSDGAEHKCITAEDPESDECKAALGDYFRGK